MLTKGCFNLPSSLSHLALRGPWGEFKRQHLDRAALLWEVRTSPRMKPVSFIIRGSRHRCETTQKFFFFFFFFFKGNKRTQFTDGPTHLYPHPLRLLWNKHARSAWSITQRLFQLQLKRACRCPPICASFFFFWQISTFRTVTLNFAIIFPIHFISLHCICAVNSFCCKAPLPELTLPQL